jgi:hypothetical protein
MVTLYEGLCLRRRWSIPVGAGLDEALAHEGPALVEIITDADLI